VSPRGPLRGSLAEVATCHVTATTTACHPLAAYNIISKKRVGLISVFEMEKPPLLLDDLALCTCAPFLASRGTIIIMYRERQFIVPHQFGGICTLWVHPSARTGRVLRKTMDCDRFIPIDLVEYTASDGYIPLGPDYEITRMVDHLIKLVRSVDIYTVSQQKLLDSLIVENYFTMQLCQRVPQ
jgi:hypothetical protein